MALTARVIDRFLDRFGRSVRTVAVLVPSLFGLVGYLLTALVPSKRDRWVFGADGGRRFVGNAKYAFLFAANEREDVRAIWLTAERSVATELRGAGYEAHFVGSLRGITLTARAEYLFVDHGLGDVTWWATGGTTVVQLWHGTPITRVGSERPTNRSPIGRLRASLSGRTWTHVVTTGEYVDRVFERAFGLSSESVLPVGYPRNDVFRGSVPDAELGRVGDVAERVRDLAIDHPVALYAPTWRVGRTGDRRGRPVDRAVDFATLDDRLEDVDGYLFVIRHADERSSLHLDDFDRIVALPPGIDPYPLLRHVDVLATDYGSVYVDFLLTDRPIVFYPYDRDSFADEPGFAFDFDAVTPGPTPRNGEGFVDALVAALDGRDGFETERAAVRAAFLDHPTGSASERLFSTLETGSVPPASAVGTPPEPAVEPSLRR